MTKPVPASAFRRAAAATMVDGLAPAIDTVAARGPESHAFLRRQWFAAALHAYGGTARTLVVEDGDEPRLAIPIVPFGPRALGLAQVPGCYWPFRGFPAVIDADDRDYGAALMVLARSNSGLRIGPVYDEDAVVAPLLAAARGRGWCVIDRFVAESFVLDMAAAEDGGGWPRASTLKKNRFHEKHLAAHGALDWAFVTGADWNDAAFDSLARVEQLSWIAERTDGRDAKFTNGGHGAFWRAAAIDPVIAGMMWAAVLRIDGAPAAFSFDLNAGALKYAIANSYDPRVGKHSPGKLLYYRNLVRALTEGITRVDWGAGDSGYKRTIGAEAGPAIRDWLLLRPGLPALAGRLLARAWRRSGHTPA
ncbi:Acetyltransferase involved in cellulose biosynthesis, CelD/BcsL family [Sphingomonas guangdongensis]|uniref:Acetyltransferase involved in cellulose biosynthesis, CelD/BcsL family n=1 Tax=Sphingomonas guangdongensis TaxID=1141890 RepID=A0A285QJ22_9SPHN|nr:GNAT family N-acetyltransferase [Sphingomonas guangdongensis]SOB80072.1 Acetyltransferase involved in cellulose biosynthesis, CelD/BcsL family [Sphingomonas guangdongensis]